jgi:polyhydroxyalkanoate synthesis regulator phasin
MSRQIINTSLAPEIQIGEVLGDLQIKGWETPQVAIQADPQELQIEEQDDTVRLSCRGDCEIRLPYGATVQLDTAKGDVEIKLLEEPLKIGTVHGSLALRKIAGAQVELVEGDFSVRKSTGDLKLAQVMGDAELREVEGDCNLTQGLGDLEVQDVEGNLNLVANGDARLRLNVMMGSIYQIQVQGDVVCSLPQDADLKASLSSARESIKVRLPNNSNHYRQGQVEFVLGGGEIALIIQAGGDITLLGEEDTGWGGGAPQPPDFGQQIARQVEAQIGSQMEEITRRMNEHVSRLSDTLGKVGMSPDETQRIIDQAMQVSERETARAQEKMRRAQEKLERKLEATQRRAEQKARSAERSSWTRPRHTWGHGRHTLNIDLSTPSAPSTPASPDTAAQEPVSEEERLMILRMLEQKKISMEEADRLLSALEGKE